MALSKSDISLIIKILAILRKSPARFNSILSLMEVDLSLNQIRDILENEDWGRLSLIQSREIKSKDEK